MKTRIILLFILLFSYDLLAIETLRKNEIINKIRKDELNQKQLIFAIEKRDVNILSEILKKDISEKLQIRIYKLNIPNITRAILKKERIAQVIKENILKNRYEIFYIDLLKRDDLKSKDLILMYETSSNKTKNYIIKNVKLSKTFRNRFVYKNGNDDLLNSYLENPYINLNEIEKIYFYYVNPINKYNLVKHYSIFNYSKDFLKKLSKKEIEYYANFLANQKYLSRKEFSIIYTSSKANAKKIMNNANINNIAYGLIKKNQRKEKKIYRSLYKKKEKIKEEKVLNFRDRYYFFGASLLNVFDTNKFLLNGSSDIQIISKVNYIPEFNLSILSIQNRISSVNLNIAYATVNTPFRNLKDGKLFFIESIGKVDFSNSFNLYKRNYNGIYYVGLKLNYGVLMITETSGMFEEFKPYVVPGINLGAIYLLKKRVLNFNLSIHPVTEFQGLKFSISSNF